MSLRKQTIVYKETDCYVLQTMLSLIRKQTLVYKEVDFLTIYVLFSIFSTYHNVVLLLCKWREGRGFHLFTECHSLTSSFLKWQQQKTKVFQSHVWIFSILLLQSPPVPLLELAAPIPGGDLIRKSSHFPTNIDGIYQYRSFS